MATGDKLATLDIIKTVFDECIKTDLITIADCDDNTLQGDGSQIHFYRTDHNTLHTPYKQGLTSSSEGVLFVFGYADYTTQIHYVVGNDKIYHRYKEGSGSTWNNKAWVLNVQGVKGNAENEYRTGAVNLTPANIGAVPTGLTTISDCDDNTLHGDGAQIHFYRTDGNTLHTPYKQGLTDAAEGVLLVLGTANYTTQIHYLVGGSQIYNRSKWGSGSTWNNKAWTTTVLGVKGNAETNYRTGNVNLTPANIGAAPSDIFAALSSNNNIDNIRNTGLYYLAGCSGTGAPSNGFWGVLQCISDTPYSSGYRVVQIFTGVFDKQMMISNYRDSWSSWTELITANGVVPVGTGGTGATTAAGARANLNITPANIGAAAANTHQINFYSSPSQLGLSGNSTVLQIFQALPDNSVIVTSEGLLASDMPNGSTLGQLVICRMSASRTFIQFFSKTLGTWRMYLGDSSYNGNNPNAPNGMWYPVVDGKSLVTVQSATKSVTVAAGYSQAVTFDLPNAANYKVLCINGYRISDTDIIPLNIGTSSGGVQHDRIDVRNLSNTSKTFTIFITWLAIWLQ